MWTLLITIYYYSVSVSQLAVPGFETKVLCDAGAADHAKTISASIGTGWAKGRASGSEVIYTCVKTKERK